MCLAPFSIADVYLPLGDWDEVISANIVTCSHVQIGPDIAGECRIHFARVVSSMAYIHLAVGDWGDSYSRTCRHIVVTACIPTEQAITVIVVQHVYPPNVISSMTYPSSCHRCIHTVVRYTRGHLSRHQMHTHRH